MNKIHIFDSTLRDGAQSEGISFSVEDKLKIVVLLDKLGIDYIEAGNPGSNEKDLQFFQRVKSIQLKHSKLVAFGSTRRKNIKVSDDNNVAALLTAGTEAISIFGKTWDYHVGKVLDTTLDENIAMIYDTINYLTGLGKEVIFDAEHFFDGYKNNPEYAMRAIVSAQEAGATTIALCDTNGGTFPLEIQQICKKVLEKISINVGIHCHDDCGMAVANSIISVQTGINHVQGTFIGFGERCGNANLSSIIGALQGKLKYDAIPQENLVTLTNTAFKLAEISNMNLRDGEPFVGRSAFAHKGGMHIDAILKSPDTFEHVNPELFGNERRFLTSEVAGRTTILSKIQNLDPSITRESKVTGEVIDKLKELEFQGYQFEGAESSFELVIRKLLGKYKPLFKLIDLKIINEQPYKDSNSATAVIKILVDDKVEITASEGNGPVNAMDKALRQVLEIFYPSVKEIFLKDYKVRILNSRTATASMVRVLIESSDGVNTWNTVGVSADIIEASWLALVDSIEYKLIKDFENKYRAYM